MKKQNTTRSLDRSRFHKSMMKLDTVGGHKLDHFARNSTTAVAAKA